MTDKAILDACCGSRMFWYDKENKDVLFMDNRELTDTLCDGRILNIRPDMIADFRAMPFSDESFDLVVFDPPHLDNLCETSYMAKKYGILLTDWRDDIRKGVNECMRVLKTGHVLIFKWSEDRIPLSEVIRAIGKKPLFGNRAKRTTIWMVFYKAVSV
jgi:SAM-dependent methyltransferase